MSGSANNVQRSRVEELEGQLAESQAQLAKQQARNVELEKQLEAEAELAGSWNGAPLEA